MKTTSPRTSRQIPAEEPCATHSSSQDASSCPTYHRILSTSLRLIKNEGFNALTVRRVASEAGVNIAAVNYHFKSKENLVDTVLGEMAAPLVQKISGLTQSALSPREKLRGILLAYASHIASFPQFVMRSLTTDAQKIHNNRSFIEIKKAGFGEIQKLFAQLFPSMDEAHLTVLMLQIFGAVAIPALFAPMQESLLQKMGLSLPNLEGQIDILLDNYLKDTK